MGHHHNFKFKLARNSIGRGDLINIWAFFLDGLKFIDGLDKMQLEFRTLLPLLSAN